MDNKWISHLTSDQEIKIKNAEKKNTKEVTWGSNIRRPYKAFNNHIYLPGSRSCKNIILVSEILETE